MRDLYPISVANTCYIGDIQIEAERAGQSCIRDREVGLCSARSGVCRKIITSRITYAAFQRDYKRTAGGVSVVYIKMQRDSVCIGRHGAGSLKRSLDNSGHIIQPGYRKTISLAECDFLILFGVKRNCVSVFFVQDEIDSVSTTVAGGDGIRDYELLADLEDARRTIFRSADLQGKAAISASGRGGADDRAAGVLTSVSDNVDRRLALAPDVGVGEERCQILVGDRYGFAGPVDLCAFIQRKGEAGGLCIDISTRVKFAFIKLGIDIGRHIIVAGVAHAELNIVEGDLIYAAIRGPAVERAAGNRDCAAVAAVDVEGVDRVNVAVFDHDVGVAALAQDAAERTTDRGVFDSEGRSRGERFDQDRAVPSAPAAAGHDDIVDDHAVGSDIDQRLVTAGSDSTAVNGDIFDGDIGIIDRDTAASSSFDFQRGLILARAFDSHATGDNRRIGQFNRTGKNIDSIAALSSSKCSGEGGVIVFAFDTGNIGCDTICRDSISVSGRIGRI